MAEELQNLLERIQKDGIEKADSQSARIISDAREKAAAIVRDAEQAAAQTATKAKQDAEQLVNRGRRSLEQSARDVILSIGSAVNQLFQEIAVRETTTALNSDTVKAMLVKVIEAYAGAPAAATGLEILMSPDDQKKLADFLISRFKDLAGKGLQVNPHGSLTAGFRVSLEGGRIQHDFSAQAIAEAMSQLLRPQLAEIVRKAIPT